MVDNVNRIPGRKLWDTTDPAFQGGSVDISLTARASQGIEICTDDGADVFDIEVRVDAGAPWVKHTVGLTGSNAYTFREDKPAKRWNFTRIVRTSGTGMAMAWDGAAQGTFSGPMFALAPPLLGDLVHWFDFSDASVNWQDAAGTVPIVAGQDVVRTDNKGTDGTPLIEAFPPGGTWTLGLVNGLAGIVNGTNFSASQQTGWLGGAGGGVGQMHFAWGRRTDALANSSTGLGWQFSGGGGDHQLRADNAVLPGDWAVAVTGIPTPTSTTRAIINNEWNWVYGGVDSGGTITYRASGSPKQTMAGVYGVSGPPATMSWGFPRGDTIEILMYGRGLSSAEQSLVTAYFDARAGATLPF